MTERIDPADPATGWAMDESSPIFAIATAAELAGDPALVAAYLGG